ncbi:MAG TPA: serine kinase [bacterium]|nr:serine kinase [bacterium]
MRLSEIIEELGLQPRTKSCDLDCEVRGCYTGDILSDVMANSAEGYIWLTIHIHPNITAVAEFKGLSGVIVVNGRVPEPETLKKAEEHKIPILTTGLSSYEIAGKLYLMGLKRAAK